MNASQRIAPVKRGGRTDARTVNQLVEQLKRLIVAGKGIRVEGMAGQVKIHVKDQIIPRGQQGDSSTVLGSSVPTVETLPTIPTAAGQYRKVFWTSAGAGTGDDQLWEVYYGQEAWTPCQKQTTKSGAVV